MFQLLRPRNADEEKGFTLLEVMVAILILTIGLMSAAMLMANVYKFVGALPIHGAGDPACLRGTRGPEPLARHE